MMGIESIFTAAAPIVGGLLGSGSTGGSTGSQTQTRTTDPRLDAYLYGADGKGGLLGDASALYQRNKSGLNQQMIDGLNRQYGIYSDPNVSAGYTQIANKGLGLLGNPVASNPFSNGQMSLNVPRPQYGMGQGMPQGQGMGQQAPQQYQAPMTLDTGMQAPPVQLGNPGAMQPATSSQPAGPFSAAPPQEVMQQPQPMTDPNKPPDLLELLRQGRYSELQALTAPGFGNGG